MGMENRMDHRDVNKQIKLRPETSDLEESREPFYPRFIGDFFMEGSSKRMSILPPKSFGKASSTPLDGLGEIHPIEDEACIYRVRSLFRICLRDSLHRLPSLWSWSLPFSAGLRSNDHLKQDRNL
ncbi:hypothetical protein WAI453_013674 [Rhynchosporium graminicola]